MVSSRLLILSVACILTSSSCGCVGIHIRPVAGRVVDAETGAGISGVEIFRTYGTDPPQVLGEYSGHRFTPDWTRSGPGGEFSFAGKWLLEWTIREPPSFTWIHPEYGWEHDVRPEPSARDGNKIVARRDQSRVNHLRETHDPIGGLDDACSRVEGDDAYSHCLAVAYGVEKHE